jgi:hypothetical protein
MNVHEATISTTSANSAAQITTYPSSIISSSIGTVITGSNPPLIGSSFSPSVWQTYSPPSFNENDINFFIKNQNYEKLVEIFVYYFAKQAGKDSFIHLIENILLESKDINIYGKMLTIPEPNLINKLNAKIAKDYAQKILSEQDIISISAQQAFNTVLIFKLALNQKHTNAIICFLKKSLYVRSLINSDQILISKIEKLLSTSDNYDDIFMFSHFISNSNKKKLLSNIRKNHKDQVSNYIKAFFPEKYLQLRSIE